MNILLLILIVSQNIRRDIYGIFADMTDSGCSNGSVFKKYSDEHFLRFTQTGLDDQLLLLFDGHTSDVLKDIKDWSKEQIIDLFVLPPYTSNVLQPLDIYYFGRLRRYITLNTILDKQTARDSHYKVSYMRV